MEGERLLPLYLYRFIRLDFVTINLVVILDYTIIILGGKRMKQLELPHQLADYLCPVNGLCDVYEWKTGKRIPEELIFYSKAGFQMISQKKAAVPKMIFMGQGSIGKREYE